MASGDITVSSAFSILAPGPGDFWRIPRLREGGDEFAWRRCAGTVLGLFEGWKPESQLAKWRLQSAINCLAVSFEEDRFRAHHREMHLSCTREHERRKQKLLAGASQRQLTKPILSALHKLECDLVAKREQIDQELAGVLELHIAPLAKYVQSGGRLARSSVDFSTIKRPLYVIVNDYAAKYPQQIESLSRRNEVFERWRRISLVACRQDVEGFFTEQRRRIVARSEAALVRRGSTLAMRLPCALPVCEEVESLPLPFVLCLSWLSCPGACALVALCPAVVAFVQLRLVHLIHCPATRRCPVCAFSIAAGVDQAQRLQHHRSHCAPWLVDGLLLRHFLVGNPCPKLTACSMSSAICAVVAAADAGDFPGVCRKAFHEGTLEVCCPHFGCAEAFGSREAALVHAVGCTQQRRPPWSVEELTARITARAQHRDASDPPL